MALHDHLVEEGYRLGRVRLNSGSAGDPSVRIRRENKRTARQRLRVDKPGRSLWRDACTFTTARAPQIPFYISKTGRNRMGRVPSRWRGRPGQDSNLRSLAGSGFQDRRDTELRDLGTEFHRDGAIKSFPPDQRRRATSISNPETGWESSYPSITRGWTSPKTPTRFPSTSTPAQRPGM